MGLAVLAVLAKVGLVVAGSSWSLPLPWVAIVGALPVLVLSDRRIRILRGIDWTTLVFFAAMFVLMSAVWDTGALQSLMHGVNVRNLPVILVGSVLLSQVLSNVPAVALTIPLLLQAGADTADMTALAAGSTLAGNLFILGAASNVIIIQRAEKEGATLGFWQFSGRGIPLTVGSILVTWAWLAW